MKLTYAVVFEQTPNNYCAYVPDLPTTFEMVDVEISAPQAARAS